MRNREGWGAKLKLRRMAAILAGVSLAVLVTVAARAEEPGRGTKGASQTRPSTRIAPIHHSQTHHSQTHQSQSHAAPAKPAGKGVGKKPAEKPLVFTDEDLKRYHDDSAPPAKRPPVAQTSDTDPLKRFKDQQERERWRQEKIAGLQQKILELEGRKKLLEQKKLSIANPLVGRPNTGEADKSAEQGLSGPELLARTEEEIRQVDQDLETARKELAKFQESPPE